MFKEFIVIWLFLIAQIDIYVRACYARFSKQFDET